MNLRLVTSPGLGVLSALLLWGCSSSEPAPVAPPPPMPDPHAVGLTPVGDGALVPDPPPPEAPWASRRRMTVDQLDASIRAATGGLFWSDTLGNDQLVTLSATLGKPDFIDSTQEDLSVSLLFQKFLGDAARDVCTRMVEGEVAGERPVLLMALAEPGTAAALTDAAVDANLQQLLLRFHGQDFDLASARLSPWRWLYTSTLHVTGDPLVAWRAVCVGLLSHPDFYSY